MLILTNAAFASFITFFIPLVCFILIFFIIALCIKKKSTVFGLTTLLFLSSIMYFIMSFDKGNIYDNIAKFGVDFNIGFALCNCISILSYPILIIHNSFIGFIASLKANQEVINFLNNEIFIILIYFFLFVITGMLSKRKKKEKKSYSDYDL